MYTFVPCIEPDPKFDMTMYTVPENDRTIPLCIDIGVELLAPVIFTIDTAQKSPPEAEGKTGFASLDLYNHVIHVIHRG